VGLVYFQKKIETASTRSFLVISVCVELGLAEIDADWVQAKQAGTSSRFM
jgi:hypothetical protein